jgi:4,5-dihydroxyphthalate decarboxylase
VNEIALDVALGDYDHCRDLVRGLVPTPGMRLTFIELDPPEINGRFSLYREWHVSEYGLGKYLAQRARGDDSIIAIPVFPARGFRHSAIYVTTASDLSEPGQLSGRRIGIPEWAQTAVTYVRGFLMHQHGLDLASVSWVQAGLTPGRVEKVALSLPPGVAVQPRPDATLEGLLLAGEVDAIITAQAPDAFLRGDGRIRRLLADPRGAEEAYYRTTGVYPIMHTVALRRDVYDAHPWIASNLVTAFEEAKQRSLRRMLDPIVWRYPLPWVPDHAERAQATFGTDFYPYGIEPNRTTLEALLEFAWEQGVAARRMEVGELFAPTTASRLHV